MNKLTAAVLAAAMVGSMAMPVWAADAYDYDGTGDSIRTRSTTVKYEVTAGYEWTIHDGIDFDKDAGRNKTVAKTQDERGQPNKVTVTKNVIGEGKKLQITVAGSGTSSKNNGFTVKLKDKTTELNYKIEETQTTIDGMGSATMGSGAKDLTTEGADANVVLEVPAGKNKAEATLKFTLSTTKDTAETAGEYEGTVTYTASIVDQPSITG